MAAYGERKDNSVQSLNRALDMLEALGTHKDGLGITALSTLVRLLIANDPFSVRAHHIEEDV